MILKIAVIQSSLFNKIYTGNKKGKCRKYGERSPVEEKLEDEEITNPNSKKPLEVVKQNQ